MNSVCACVCVLTRVCGCMWCAHKLGVCICMACVGVWCVSRVWCVLCVCCMAWVVWRVWVGLLVFVE